MGRGESTTGECKWQWVVVEAVRGDGGSEGVRGGGDGDGGGGARSD